MQPYFLPYLGYFQLMKASDTFVVYDNIQFTKKGWINRNRMLLNGKDITFSLPLKKDSDYLNLDKRYLADNFEKEKNKILGQIRSAYSKATHFRTVYPMIEGIFNYNDKNLFAFIYNSIIKVNEYLHIDTPIIISSKTEIDHELKNKFKVMALCHNLGGDVYINPIGGMELYDKEEFKRNGINLYFHKMRTVSYNQFGNDFVPSLSIMDVLMFNDEDAIQKILLEYDLI